MNINVQTDSFIKEPQPGNYDDVSEHTERLDTGSGYFELNELYLFGDLCCQYPQEGEDGVSPVLAGCLEVASHA
jgi:hypothetical protein